LANRTGMAQLRGTTMKFWDEMNDKYGFNDGGAYPDGIDLYRDVYVKAVNKLAENRNSELRVVPFDRAGVHNYCLWMVVPKDWFETEYLPKQKENKVWEGVEFKDIPNADQPEPQPDEELDLAIQDAMEMDLDGFLDTTTVVNDEFAGFLEKM